jgi:DNA-binding response OmpR family regulator
MKNKKILIVDNEQDINLSLEILLEENGFEVDTFDDPVIALEYFKKGVYDLLILDILMPKMHGSELVEKD